MSMAMRPYMLVKRMGLRAIRTNSFGSNWEKVRSHKVPIVYMLWLLWPCNSISYHTQNACCMDKHSIKERLIATSGYRKGKRIFKHETCGILVRSSKMLQPQKGASSVANTKTINPFPYSTNTVYFRHTRVSLHKGTCCRESPDPPQVLLLSALHKLSTSFSMDSSKLEPSLEVSTWTSSPFSFLHL